MEVKISQIAGVRFEIQARSHTITCDQPAENGGEDSGMAPLNSCWRHWAPAPLSTPRNTLELVI